MPRMLKPRAGFTLVEVIVALVLTAVIGAAVTGVFVTQARFFDTQEKVGFARGVSRGAMNMIISELRMLEQGGGVISATNTQITVRAPYAMGIVCGNSTNVTVSWLPADSFMVANAWPSGYAFRAANGTYTYVVGTPAITNAGASVCTTANITVVTEGTNGGAIQISGVPSPAPDIGAPLFLYQDITYEFRNSVSFPGRRALWRRIDSKPSPNDEELVAPFDTTARFRFFVNDAATAQTAVPGALNTITGLELTLDGLSDRPDRNGNRQRVPLTTSVFFKNRP